MSKITSTFSKQDGLKSSEKKLGGAYLTEVPRSASVPQHSKMKKAKSATSRSTNLAATFNSTGSSGKLTKSLNMTKNDLGNIEAEYIKNLQQQIYFLELESNYLRDQAKKSTEMHPKMQAEAERMLEKLRRMQSDIDRLNLEIKDKDGNLAESIVEREKLLDRLREEEVSRSREKRTLMDEIFELKKERETLTLELNSRECQVSEARRELEISATALKNAELKIQTLMTQLDQRGEQHKMTQLALDEKRAELLSVETQLREVEEKYYNNTVQMQDKLTNDLRDEIRVLRQKLKETEMNADHDRYLKSKVSEDSAILAKENTALTQQVQELQKQLERERELRNSNEVRHNHHMSELIELREREKDTKFELQHVRDQLKKEQERTQLYAEKLTKMESMTTSAELQYNTAKSRISEVENSQKTLEIEASQLRKDKSLLVEHVSDLQRKLQSKEHEIELLRNQVKSLEARMKDVEHLQSLEATVQSQKWEEFEKLAESMRNLSHNMSKTGGTSTTTSALKY